MFKKTIKNLLYFSTSSEVLLLFATLAALYIANSALYEVYRDFLKNFLHIKLNFLNFAVDEKITLKFFIDDFLMAIFFLLIGLELKRELLVGELSTADKVFLPTIAAIGGVIAPALIFSYFNINAQDNLRGFAIPTATDIAFAYAVVKAFGNRISSATKVFIITLAVIDDLIAIFIIAFFYTEQLHALFLLYSFIVMFVLFLLSIKKSENLFFYTILGFLLWLCILQSGIHPSVSGVVLAMFIPFRTANQDFLENFAHNLAPFVNFFILPFFAFANAGVQIVNFSLQILYDPLIMGIVFGLFLGKQIGVVFFSFIAFKLKICQLPKDCNWLEFYGVAILTGIGFTMSLFIGNLAFDSDEILDKVKIAVLLGSSISFIFGSLILLFVKKKENIIEKILN